MPIQRAGPLAGIGSLLSELGASPDAVGAACGVDIAALTADTVFSFATGLSLLDQAARATGCDHFGLRLGLAYDPRGHGLIYDLMRTAPTLGDALLSFVAWQPGFSSGATIYLNRIGNDFAWGYAVFDRTLHGSRHVYDLVMGVGTVMVRDLTGGRASIQEFLVTHRPPSDRRAHERLLRAPVRFNQGQTCAVLSGAAIAMPLPTADAGLHAEMQGRVADALADTMRSTVARVRRLLRTQLLYEDVSFRWIADTLRLHPRTLRRRLADEGTSFEAILEGVRFNSACELLDLTDMPVGEISAALGYGSQSTFNHAFRRWSQSSPGQWRNRAMPDRRSPATAVERAEAPVD